MASDRQLFEASHYVLLSLLFSISLLGSHSRRVIIIVVVIIIIIIILKVETWLQFLKISTMVRHLDVLLPTKSSKRKPIVFSWFFYKHLGSNFLFLLAVGLQIKIKSNVIFSTFEFVLRSFKKFFVIL